MTVHFVKYTRENGCTQLKFVLCLTLTALDCGTPPAVTNGSPGAPDMTTFGGTVTYTCDNGFTLSGSAMITCLATGMWDTPPSCTGV